VRRHLPGAQQAFLEFFGHIQVLSKAWYDWCEFVPAADDRRNQEFCDQTRDIFDVVRGTVIETTDFADWQTFLNAWLRDFSRNRTVLVRQKEQAQARVRPSSSADYAPSAAPEEGLEATPGAEPVVVAGAESAPVNQGSASEESSFVGLSPSEAAAASAAASAGAPTATADEEQEVEQAELEKERREAEERIFGVPAPEPVELPFVNKPRYSHYLEKMKK
jgi:hypothetical protein